MAVTKKFYDEWLEDDRYLCSVRLLPTALGEWKWGFMDLNTGRGFGGWVDTNEQAHEQCAAMVKNNQEDNK